MSKQGKPGTVTPKTGQSAVSQPRPLDEKRGGHQPNVPQANWGQKPPPVGTAIQTPKKGS